MSPGAGTGMLNWGVAAGLLAATLAGAGCSDRPDEASARAATLKAAVGDEAAQTLASRWLIPPLTSLEPPLAAPVAIDVDIARGRLYLLELQPPELRVYDLQDGRFIGAMGREGDGPGEFRFPVDLAVSSTGVAAVLSMGGRVAFWTADGRFAGEVRTGTGLATDLLAARGDTFYVKSDLFPPHDYAEIRVVVTDSALTKARFRDEGLAGLEEAGTASKNHSYAVSATPNGDLLISPPGGDYVIYRIGPGGELRQTIRRLQVPPLLRSEEEAEAVLERVRKGFAAAGRATPQSLRVPLYRPHISRLAVSADASIWALTGRGDGETAIVDHFSAGGSFLASYRLPLSAGDLVVGERSIYLLARGAHDVAGVALTERPRITGERAATR